MTNSRPSPANAGQQPEKRVLLVFLLFNGFDKNTIKQQRHASHEAIAAVAISITYNP